MVRLLGSLWDWLTEQELIRPAARTPVRALAAFRPRRQGRRRGLPPADSTRVAPVDRDFHGWVAARYGQDAARAAANLMGVATFDADPGRLSVAFVWERMRRVFGRLPPAARYVRGGWGPCWPGWRPAPGSSGSASSWGAGWTGCPSRR